MKLKLVLLALCIIITSCEEEAYNISINKSKESENPFTRSIRPTTALALDPIKQLENIPVHIMLSDTKHPYRYLSCSKSKKVDLWDKDDNSGRQQWFIKPFQIRPVNGISGDLSELSITFGYGSKLGPQLLKGMKMPSGQLITTTSIAQRRNTSLYTIMSPTAILQAKNYTSNSLEGVRNEPQNGITAPINSLNSFIVAPIEEFTLLDISYDFLTGDTFSTEPKKLIRRGFRNNTTEPITRVLKIQESLINTSTFQETYGLTVSTTVKGTVQVGLPKIVGGNVDVSQTTTKEWKYSTTQTETRNFTIEESFTQTIHPGEAVDFRLVWSEYKMNLTYIAKLQGKTTGTIIYLPGRWDGIVVEDCTIEAFNPDNQSTIETRSISKE